jgi:hypothetical protein
MTAASFSAANSTDAGVAFGFVLLKNPMALGEVYPQRFPRRLPFGSALICGSAISRRRRRLVQDPLQYPRRHIRIPVVQIGL